jgi:hypothetical protein
MRIVNSDANEYQAGRTYVDITFCFAIKDTIEITNEEWNDIWFAYYEYKGFAKEPVEFSQYLCELIELRRAK